MVIDETPKWYVLHTTTGYENVAKQNLEMVVEKNNLQDRVFEIICPEEDVIQTKSDGKQVVVKQKQLPTYLLVKMRYGDDIWHAITRTRGITGFVGPKGRPLALTEGEIKRMGIGGQVSGENFDIQPFDKVEIVEGAFKTFIGEVQEIDAQNKKVKVNVEVFGRLTPIEIDMKDVSKIN